MKLQSHLPQQPSESFFDAHANKENLHGEAMRRKLDFAEMVSQGRAELTKHIQKRA
jgi:hypothetical protein